MVRIMLRRMLRASAHDLDIGTAFASPMGRLRQIARMQSAVRAPNEGGDRR
jgi:hypothetical protein